MERDDVRARRSCEDSRSVEDVGVAGNLSERCEGTDVDEIGRNRRELRELQSESDTLHDEQG